MFEKTLLKISNTFFISLSILFFLCVLVMGELISDIFFMIAILIVLFMDIGLLIYYLRRGGLHNYWDYISNGEFVIPFACPLYCRDQNNALKYCGIVANYIKVFSGESAEDIFEGYCYYALANEPLYAFATFSIAVLPSKCENGLENKNFIAISPCFDKDITFFISRDDIEADDNLEPENFSKLLQRFSSKSS